MPVNAVIDSIQEIEVQVTEADGPKFMTIYCGTATFNFTGHDANWRRDRLEFYLPKRLSSDEFHRAIASAAPSSLSNDDHAVWAGWAVDRVGADYDDDEQKVKLWADIAIRDCDGHLDRISFQAYILWQNIPRRMQKVQRIDTVAKAVD